MQNPSAAGSIVGLHIYPVKGCRGLDLQTATLAAGGLAQDRRWQISLDGAPVTQRTHPVLATVRPELVDGGLRLSAEGRGSVEVATPGAADSDTHALTAVPVRVGDAGDEAAAWLAGVLDTAGVRLHGLPDGHVVTPPEAVDLLDEPIAFGDLCPILVANTATLAWLVDRADEPFGMDRFRANVVIDAGEAFAEEGWDGFDAGPASFRCATAWPRCAVPQVDQQTGTRHKEPAKVLARYRKVTSAPDLPAAMRSVVEGSAVFGVGCGAGPVGATIAVGDPVTVTATRTPLLPAPTT